MDLVTNLIIKLGFILYEIYAKIVYTIAVLFPSFTKFVTDKLAYQMYGITINGPEPTDPKVLVPAKFYPRVVSYLSYGLATGYVNKEWTVDDLVGATVKIIKTNRYGYMLHPMRHIMVRLNLQSRKKAWEVAVHYNVGNELYEAIFGKNLQYSSGYWRNADNLDEALLAKMDLAARKLHLKPGMRVLDIGCGFGTMACYLAKNFNVSVVGCTISMEQYKYFQDHLKGSFQVDIRLCDYRDMNEKFDRIICTSMIEHVGPKNYDTFMAVADRCLTNEGIFLIECWGIHDPKFPSYDVWLCKDVLPNMVLPYFHELWSATKKQWIIEDWHNMSDDFLKTTMAWRVGLEKVWPQMQSKFGEGFCRSFLLFLCIIEGSFVAKKINHIQMILRKMARKGSYVSVR